jgi:hypothetical protein
MGAFFQQAGALAGVQSWASGFASFLKVLLSAFKDWAVQVIKAVAGALKRIAGGVLDALRALLRGDWSRLWHDIVNAWKVLREWAQVIYKTIYGPIDQMRRTIGKLYDTFWKPVINVIDSMRRITQVIGIFDRKLAQRLDQRLWALEGKILAPITAMYGRLNSISSYFSAIITATGLLDRPLLLASVKRDVSLLWHTLVNPFGQTPKPVTAVVMPTIKQSHDAVVDYWNNGSGDLAPAVDSARQYYNELTAGLG